MTVDIEKLKAFLSIVDWEGGLEGAVQHGVDETGDPVLSQICEETEALLGRWNKRLDDLYNEYPELETDD